MLIIQVIDHSVCNHTLISRESCLRIYKGRTSSSEVYTDPPFDRPRSSENRGIVEVNEEPQLTLADHVFET